jgi:hypothetical protein
VHRSPYLAALNWGLTVTVMASDQQNDTLAARKRILEPSVNRAPRRVQVHAVKVEDTIGLNGAGSKPPIPTSVERCSRPRRLWCGSFRRASFSARPELRRGFWPLFFSRLRRTLFARQRRDRRGHPRPERGLLSAE